MAIIHPFRALRDWPMPGEGGGRRADLTPAYYLLKIGNFGRAPARFLLCGLSAGAGVQELESGLAQTSSEPVLAIAADDHQVFWKLLAEAALERPADWESAGGERPLRLWRMSASPLW